MDRLLRHFLLRNPDGLTDAELLELLLRFTNGDAQARSTLLLQHFGGICGVLDADAEELGDASDESTALLLRLVAELHRRYFLSRARSETRLTDTAAYGAYLLPHFFGATEELVYLLCLDAAGRVLGCELLGRGSINSANVPMRRLVQQALHFNASGIVLAHNHPSGLALPSNEDISLTLRLQDALDVMDILLIDHLIIASDDFVSLRDSGYLRRY